MKVYMDNQNEKKFQKNYVLESVLLQGFRDLKFPEQLQLKGEFVIVIIPINCLFQIQANSPGVKRE